MSHSTTKRFKLNLVAVAVVAALGAGQAMAASSIETEIFALSPTPDVVRITALNGTRVIGSLTVTDGLSLTGGAADLGAGNVTTTGTIGAGAITGTSVSAGAGTVSGNLGSFTNLGATTLTGTLNAAGQSISNATITGITNWQGPISGDLNLMGGNINGAGAINSTGAITANAGFDAVNAGIARAGNIQGVVGIDSTLGTVLNVGAGLASSGVNIGRATQANTITGATNTITGTAASILQSGVNNVTVDSNLQRVTVNGRDASILQSGLNNVRVDSVLNEVTANGNGAGLTLNGTRVSLTDANGGAGSGLQLNGAGNASLLNSGGHGVTITNGLTTVSGGASGAPKSSTWSLADGNANLTVSNGGATPNYTLINATSTGAGNSGVTIGDAATSVNSIQGTRTTIQAGANTAVVDNVNGLTVVGVSNTVTGTTRLQASAAAGANALSVDAVNGTVVTGPTSLNGALAVSGSTSLNNNLAVAGNASLNGAVNNIGTTQAGSTNTIGTTGSTNTINGAVNNIGTNQASTNTIGTAGSSNTLVGTTNLVSSNGSSQVQVNDNGVNVIGNTASVQGRDSAQISGGSTSLTLNNNGASFSQNGAPVRVTGVANGVNPYDAVNKSQLDMSTNGIYSRIGDLQSKAYSGIASVAAMASIPEPTAGHNYTVGIGYGNFGSQSAVAFGGKANVGDSVRVAANLGYAGSELTVGLGTGFSW
ncbi:MAG: YadA-like family protein [Proteobacteria bacterium]|nr:YadA-like family protein [Pseudomonadota bacterium]